MKIEEVIKQLESILDHTHSMAASPDADGIWKEDIAALEFALTALRSMPEAGEPLSLEQLREMDGQPVWCEDVERWAIVSVSDAGKWKGVPFALFEKNGGRFEWNVEDRELSLYFYPPAHIDRETWTAKWIEDGDCEHKPHRIRDVKKWRKYKCSKCGYKAGRSNSRNYCPSCGRAMTPEAWAELERRLRG